MYSFSSTLCMVRFLVDKAVVSGLDRQVFCGLRLIVGLW